MRLEGEKLYYRKIVEADTDMVLRWRNSDYVRNHFIHRDMISREEHLRWLHSKVETGKVIQFIMVERTTDIPVGSVYLRDVEYEEKTAEYGIFIGEADSRGKGYGTEAAQVIIKYAFGQLRMKSLALRVLEDNKRAIQSYEKAGFQVDIESTEQLWIDGKEETLLFMKIFAGKESNE